MPHSMRPVRKVFRQNRGPKKPGVLFPAVQATKCSAFPEEKALVAPFYRPKKDGKERPERTRARFAVLAGKPTAFPGAGGSPRVPFWRRPPGIKNTPRFAAGRSLILFVSGAANQSLSAGCRAASGRSAEAPGRPLLLCAGPSSMGGFIRTSAETRLRR